MWNLAGFPELHPDESDYLRKSLYVLNGYGPQESSDHPIAYREHPYTHPYFGQLFLAGLLGAVGYPNSLHPGADIKSIEMLHLVPRLMLGILAVIDTFLIYKISESRYNKNVALIASVLFAVMPMTWILRRIYLDNLLMPLLLSSILFALYIRQPNNSDNQRTHRIKINENLVVLSSGIFLGLAIYTKIPAFTMIPIVGFLVLSNSKSRKKALVIWLLPVILIPLLWPGYAIMNGEFNLWLNGVMFQQNRGSPGTGERLYNAFDDLFKIDPILLILGTMSLGFIVLRRDYWLLLWTVPFLVFSFYLGWVQYFHLVPIFPIFCISLAVAIDWILHRVKNGIARGIYLAAISIFVLFGLISTGTLVTLNMNSIQYHAYASLIKELSQRAISDSNDSKEVVLVGHRMYLWIPQYIFDFHFSLLPRSGAVHYIPENMVLVANDHTCCCNCDYFKELYAASKPKYDYSNHIYDYDKGQYPFTSLQLETALGKEVEIRTK
jgi:dolichyl-phosphate-mannose-protein mannosyltransferase